MHGHGRSLCAALKIPLRRRVISEIVANQQQFICFVWSKGYSMLGVTCSRTRHHQVPRASYIVAVLSLIQSVVSSNIQSIHAAQSPMSYRARKGGFITLYCLIALQGWRLVSAFLTGAPLAACNTLSPNPAAHGAPPSDCPEPCPFRMSLVEIDGVQPNGAVTVYRCGATHTSESRYTWLFITHMY